MGAAICAAHIVALHALQVLSGGQDFVIFYEVGFATVRLGFRRRAIGKTLKDPDGLALTRVYQENGCRCVNLCV